MTQRLSSRARLSRMAVAATVLLTTAAPGLARAAEPPGVATMPGILGGGVSHALPGVLRMRVAAPSVAPTPQAAEQPVEMSSETKQSLGCLITGTAATGVAMAAGGENLVNIIAGGVVVPQSRAVLYIGLVGVVFASFCAIGQALTPLYLHMTEDEPVVAPPVQPSLHRTIAPAPWPAPARHRS